MVKRLLYLLAGVGNHTLVRAIELLRSDDNKFNKIIISTPIVEADEKLGFLPGDMREKMDPYLSSSLDIFDKLIGKNIDLNLRVLGSTSIGQQG
jgi:phosphate starvation-inducible PhoH-like protein